jgi:glycerophosphoryl diester phosphodiesterase
MTRTAASSLAARAVLALLLIGVSGSGATQAASPHTHHSRQLDVNHKKPVQTFRPINIAHRGSNGELPEETAAAYLVELNSSCFFCLFCSEQNHTRTYVRTVSPWISTNKRLKQIEREKKHLILQRAIEEGADFIETDVLASKDGHLVCFHDVTLDATTDVADHAEFAGRKRTYEVQGEDVTGWFIGISCCC